MAGVNGKIAGGWQMGKIARRGQTGQIARAWGKNMPHSLSPPLFGVIKGVRVSI